LRIKIITKGSFKGSEEFNDLANSFNIMAEKLQEYESSTLSEQLMDKNGLKPGE
jgi:hypothetical protein